MKTNIKHISNIKILLGCAIFFSLLAVYALRDNNLRMIELRDNVVVVDEANGDVATALDNLRKFVYAHMNTDLASGDFAIRPPIQLKATYERLVKAERDRVVAFNEQIYVDAQQTCENRFSAPGTGQQRLECIEQEVATNRQEPQPIPDALYKFDFISPRWSPDLAGWSLVLAGFFWISTAGSFLFSRWLQSRHM